MHLSLIQANPAIYNYWVSLIIPTIPNFKNPKFIHSCCLYKTQAYVAINQATDLILNLKTAQKYTYFSVVFLIFMQLLTSLL